MIEYVKFQNFKSFSRLKLENVKPITLISGKNNVGKSSVLDGLFLFLDHLSPDSFTKINNFRGYLSSSEPNHVWEPFFHNLDTSLPIQIEIGFPAEKSKLQYTRDESYVIPDNIDVPQNVLNQFLSSTKPSYTLKFQYSCNEYKEEGHFIANSGGLLRNMKSSLGKDKIRTLPFTQFINAAIVQSFNAATLLGEIELRGEKEELIDILRLIEPAITDILTIMTAGGGAQVYIKANGKLLPIKLTGDGLNKLLFIILSMQCHPGSLLLIDEIETGIHYSAYIDVWKKIAVVAKKRNCQVIATTHSYECITAAADGLKEANLEADFCYFRLEEREDGLHVARYSDELLRIAIDSGLEVR